MLLIFSAPAGEFPITAITRDGGDHGDFLIFLFSPNTRYWIQWITW
jgi:hypothetical protein